MRESHYHELAHKYLGGQAGEVRAFGLKGGYDADGNLVSVVGLFSHLADMEQALGTV